MLGNSEFQHNKIKIYMEINIKLETSQRKESNKCKNNLNNLNLENSLNPLRANRFHFDK